LAWSLTLFSGKSLGSGVERLLRLMLQAQFCPGMR
jgi:hypothetical protein